MKDKIVILVVSLFCQITLAQTAIRKPLTGQVVSDSQPVESGWILNINAKVRTFIGVNGSFEISARSRDTLLITSLAFQSKKIVVTEKDLSEGKFLIRLDVQNNELKEVLVGKELKVKSLGVGSQKLVDLEFEDDKQSTAKNIAMLSDQTIKYGTDFVRIFKDVKKLLNKKEDTEEYITDVAFIEYVKLNFTNDFFKETLHLKSEEIDLFLLYCSNDAEARNFLKPEDQFLLMDFMINKNKDFKNITLVTK